MKVNAFLPSSFIYWRPPSGVFLEFLPCSSTMLWSESPTRRTSSHKSPLLSRMSVSRTDRKINSCKPHADSLCSAVGTVLIMTLESMAEY
ncbi:hypothetical protein LIPSTDRAFT_66902 [Lipomyces starkeyi NRRL Y-11557]|uniref:Uncharacterized protein n=1 Tax=Lipomyces starkeyi NRRL Y-11557 TaxID=675824 RepID=A0A1E3QF26_LIPST|nr:hypothetical protein LIPSTDRAFT_66902 [Lipomyces starkeyi NRRL Y-11557]